jgi:hypothetical protein
MHPSVMGTIDGICFAEIDEVAKPEQHLSRHVEEETLTNSKAVPSFRNLSLLSGCSLSITL